MFGAVCGDIIGSYFENHVTKNYDFDLFCRESTFTDDTVLTVAVCDAILYNDKSVNGILEKRQRETEYAYRYKQYYSRYPYSGYGQMFSAWAKEKDLRKQKSYANGAAMRVIPIAYAYDDIKQVIIQAKCSAIYTHNHPEAIRGAKIIASACFLARNKQTKIQIKEYLASTFGLKFDFTIDSIRPNYVFDSRTNYTVPVAVAAFLESYDYEDAIRKAVSLGGDSDTIATMTGGIAEAFYGNVPDYIKSKCWGLLDSGLRNIINEFRDKYFN